MAVFSMINIGNYVIIQNFQPEHLLDSDCHKEAK